MGGSGQDRTAGRPVRRYAHHLAVDFSLSSVELRFGQRTPTGEADFHSLLVLSPIDLVTFGRLIQAGIERYESRFGPIPDGSEPDAGMTKQ